MPPVFYETCLAARRAIVADGAMLGRLRAVIRAHHEGRAGDIRLDEKRELAGRAGSNRAVYALGQIHADSLLLHVATKIVIPRTLFYRTYGRDSELTARELGVFDHLAAQGQNVPAFVLGLTYSFDGETRFGLVMEDLTLGGTCRLEMIDSRSRIADGNHQLIQVHPNGKRVEIWSDVKTWGFDLRSDPDPFAVIGQKYLGPDACIELAAV